MQRTTAAFGQKRNPAAEHHRIQRDFHSIDQSGVEQAAEQDAAAEEPDVLLRRWAGLRLQRFHGFRDAARKNGHVGVMFRLKRRRDDDPALAKGVP